MDPARPGTPQSPLTNSLYRASSTIDDLTAALTDFSRVPSPEPPSSLTCCCGREDCQNLAAWLNLKSRLESRLIFSAEVGQALLQRHEAYVRKFENRSRGIQAGDEQSELMDDTLDEQVSALMKEKAVLERRLHQVLVNNEVTEVSNKTILQELQDARTTISRLTAHHARSVGWDARLAAATKECDDMQQERDSESHRAQLAETRLAALKDKTTKLQVEVRRLQESLEEKRLHRLESSESILQDARVRLETIHKSQLGASALVEQDELMKVLESLVKDNEALKRDSAELQNLLAESREDYHAMRQEVEEQRANPPPPPVNTHSRHSSKHSHNGSVTSISFNTMHQRALSVDRRSIRTFEPLTPLDSPRALLSPISRTSFRHGPPPPTSPIDGDDDSQDRPKGLRPLLLLSRSCGVQTEPWLGQLTPSPLPSHLSLSSPQDPRSESSSFSESLNSHISTLLDRVAALLNRMTQADALTLRNRLKRQHLKGADVNHLSRSTVGNIVNEATGLRAQFRVLLEDESLVTTCTRKDLRLLFKLFKDVFTEMGQMRVTLNEVVLDPSSAPRVSELALNPTKAEAELREKERDAVAGVSAIGWMAPISKLFSPTVRVEPISTPERTPRGRTATSRFVPKLGPALAASATTVNVEFSGAGVGRSVSSTVEGLQPAFQDVSAEPSPLSQSVMGIFAGAPKPAPTDPDPWVVLPKAPRRVQSFMRAPETPRQGTIGRSAGRMAVNGLSRNVDAVIDVRAPLEEDEEPDYVPPLLERTLRRRGLSDSSIHSTFTAHGDDASPLSPAFPAFPRTYTKNLPDRGSVFQVLSRTVQNFRLTPSGGSSVKSPAPVMERSISEGGDLAATTSQLKVVPETPRKASSGTGTLRSLSPGIAQFLPTMSLASWAAASVGVEPMSDVEPFIPGSSFREESFMHRNAPRKEYEREYTR